MPIVLAIEPDRRQAAHVSAVVRHRVGAELILADTTEGALDAIGSRVPDLVLVPALLSPQDDAALAAALRVIAAAAHVRTLTIPVFANTAAHAEGGGLLSRLRWGRSEYVSSVGCDPAVFAEQINEYLREAAAERADLALDPRSREAQPSAAVEESPFIESSFVRSPAADTLWEPPVAPPIVESRIAEPQVAEPQVVEPRIVEPRIVEPRIVEPRIAEPRIIQPTAFEASLVESVLFDAPSAEAESEPAMEAAVEPVRLIAPVVARPRTTPVEPRKAASDAVEAARSTEPADVPDVPDFAAAAAAEFGDRTFVDPPSEPAALEEEWPEIVEPPLKAATAANEELFDSEPISIYTLSFDQSLDPAPAAEPVAAAREIGGGDRPNLQEFVEPEPVPLEAADANVEAAAKKPADEPAWLTLGLRYTRQWPVMEGAIVESGGALTDFVAAINRTAALAAKHARPAAADATLPASQVTATPPPTPTPATASPTPTPRGDHLDWSELVASLRQDIERRRKQPTPPPAAASAPPRTPEPHARPHLHAVEGAGGRRGRKSSPVEDEWGFFDPQQCGFAALLAKLDEFSDAADEPDVRKTS